MLRRNSFHALLSPCSDVYARSDIADRVGARRAGKADIWLNPRALSAGGLGMFGARVP
jgi:hypothetical protein